MKEEVIVFFLVKSNSALCCKVVFKALMVLEVFRRDGEKYRYMRALVKVV